MKKIIIFLFLLVCNTVIFAGNEVVEGYIFNDKKGIPDLTVKTSEKSKPVKTNRKGHFRIKGIATESDTLFVSGLIHNEVLIIPLWGANQITIRQTKDSVFVGRERRKVPPVSAYGGTMVTRETLETTGETNLLKAIALKVPGVEYANDNLIIRGINSINSNIYPLYILDGTETTYASFLTVVEVETVEILKDASTSIFGMRGGNGVVIINRKK